MFAVASVCVEPTFQNQTDALLNMMLEHLCVQLKSLEGIEALSLLEVLDASENKIASLAPLASLVNLKNLALLNNSLCDFKELEHLKPLTKSLHSLTLGPSKSNTITSYDRHIPPLLEMLQSLVVLDNQSVHILKVRMVKGMRA